MLAEYRACGLERELVVAITAAVLVALSGTVRSWNQEDNQLREGLWVRVKGERGIDGKFIASEVEVRSPEDEEALLGIVERVLDDERFEVLGQEVHSSAKTLWEGITPSKLLGSRVKVSGYFRGRSNFSAREIEAREPGRDRLEGRIDALRRISDGVELEVMNIVILVERALDPISELPIAEMPIIERRWLDHPESAQPRVRDEDDLRLGSIRIGPDIAFGGQFEWETTHERNFDLDQADEQDRTDNEVVLRGEAVWEPSENGFVLIEGRTRVRWREDEADGFERNSESRLSELYGYWRNAAGLGFDLAVGRRDFDDPREWIYDQNLDALTVIWNRPDLRAELSVSTSLSDGSPRDEATTNWIGYVSNNQTKRHLAAWAMLRDRRDEAGDHPLHFGVRALGDWLPRSRSWFELAFVRGELDGRELVAHGFDLGTTLAPWGTEGVNFTAGWAYGSGDADSTGDNGNFVQTGLQDNNDRYLGVTSFRYYGELVDPELSNLSIVTAGLGLRFGGGDSSLDLVLHKYDQVEAFDRIRDASLDLRPNGEERDLGWEADLVFGNRSLRAWHFEVVLGAFHPGDAFPGADDAFLGRVQIRSRF